jgi:hypothetical protein
MKDEMFFTAHAASLSYADVKAIISIVTSIAYGTQTTIEWSTVVIKTALMAHCTALLDTRTALEVGYEK